MGNPVDLRPLLLDRRQRLQVAISEFEDTSRLAHLLQEVDLALERMERGTYGLCEACQGTIEEELLIADPLCRFCLDDLTPDQQHTLEQDLYLASRIQDLLLPKLIPGMDGWEMAFHYEARGPVGGDYCDLVEPESEGGDWVFLLGDVSGKGVAASMFMTHLHATFRSLIPLGLPVNRLVERANRVFYASTLSEHFATLVCGRTSRSGEVEICNGGHVPPLWVHRGKVTGLRTTDIALGILPTEYSSTKIQLAPGDSLFLYTDGLSEAVDRFDNQYGVERLSKLVGDSYALPPQALISACLEDLKAFRAGVPLADDLTIMVIRRVVH